MIAISLEDKILKIAEVFLKTSLFSAIDILLWKYCLVNGIRAWKEGNSNIMHCCLIRIFRSNRSSSQMEEINLLHQNSTPWRPRQKFRDSQKKFRVYEIYGSQVVCIASLSIINYKTRGKAYVLLCSSKQHIILIHLAWGTTCIHWYLQSVFFMFIWAINRHWYIVDDLQ